MQTREIGPVPVVIERPSKNAQVRRRHRRRMATFITKGAFYAKETFFHHPAGDQRAGLCGRADRARPQRGAG